MNSNGPSYGSSVGSNGPRTISEAVNATELVHQHLMDAASVAERIADILGGPVPEPTTGNQKAGLNSSCMADHLNQRVDALRDPAIRITTALDRIERRLG